MVNGSRVLQGRVPTRIELPATTDVAIIGGGFAGCATAWALAARGVQAVIIEREPELGRHASGHGAGLGRQLAEDEDTAALAVRGAALLRRHFPHVWSETGGVLAFDNPARAAEYVERAERLGVPYARLDRAAVLALWPELVELPVAAAVEVPSDGVIDVRALLARLAAGQRVVFGAPVVRIADGRVETERGVTEARVVVDASGAWAGAAAGDPPLDVYRRHLFVLEAQGRASAPYLWHLGAEEMYVRTDGAHLLVSPCDGEAVAPGEQLPTPEGDAALADRLRAAPTLGAAPVLRKWACQRAFAPDRRMRLGRDPARPWLVWAAALGGHGATAAPAIGEVVADAVIAALAER